MLLFFFCAFNTVVSSAAGFIFSGDFVFFAINLHLIICGKGIGISVFLTILEDGVHGFDQIKIDAAVLIRNPEYFPKIRKPPLS